MRTSARWCHVLMSFLFAMGSASDMIKVKFFRAPSRGGAVFLVRLFQDNLIVAVSPLQYVTPRYIELETKNFIGHSGTLTGSPPSLALCSDKNSL